MQSEWRPSTIGLEASILLGFAFKSAAFSGEPPGHRLLRGDNVKRGFIEWGDKARFWPAWSSELERYLLRSGDVVVGMDGSRVGENFAVVTNADLPALLVQRVACLRAKEQLYQGFLRYLICNPEFTKYIKSVQTGTSIPHISGRQIAEYAVLVPPMRTQVAIASMLQAMDDRIDLLNQTNATLESIAQVLFKSWFIDFDPVHAKAEGREPGAMDGAVASLFPASFEESALGLIPKGWGAGTVEDLFVLQRGFDLPASQRTDGPFTVFAASGPHGTHSTPMAKGPGVVTGRSGVIGRVFYTHKDYWPLNTALWVKQFKTATPPYAFQFLQTMDLARLNAGSAVPTLNRNHVHAQPAVIPPAGLIGVYTAIAESLLDRVRTNSEHVRSLESLRDTLLPQLISGKLRLPDAQAQARAQLEEAIA
jgi:type I restriction enzyme S subunit